MPAGTTGGRTRPSRKARRRSAACSAVIVTGVGAGGPELRYSSKASRKPSVAFLLRLSGEQSRLSQRRTQTSSRRCSPRPGTLHHGCCRSREYRKRRPPSPSPGRGEYRTDAPRTRPRFCRGGGRARSIAVIKAPRVDRCHATSLSPCESFAIELSARSSARVAVEFSRALPWLRSPRGLRGRRAPRRRSRTRAASGVAG